jgi:hypothetical protein
MNSASVCHRRCAGEIQRSGMTHFRNTQRKLSQRCRKSGAIQVHLRRSPDTPGAIAKPSHRLTTGLAWVQKSHRNPNEKRRPRPKPGSPFRFFGVANGTRTHDNQNHNLGLYQLSYSHRRASQYSRTHEWMDNLVAQPSLKHRGSSTLQGSAPNASAARCTWASTAKAAFQGCSAWREATCKCRCQARSDGVSNPLFIAADMALPGK